MSRKDLFRQEVQEELNFGKMGEVILLPNPKSSVLVYLLFSIFAVIFLFLAFANYNEKQKVAGIVVPDKGIIKVFPKREGVVQDIRVKEGQRIQEGDQIASLVNHVSLEGGDSVQLLQKKNLEAIHQNIETTLANLPKRKQIEFDELSTRHKQSLKEIKLLESQLGILRERVKLLKTRTTQLKTLQASALISTHEFEQSKDRLLSLQQLQKQKEEDILAKKTVVHSLASTIENLDYKYDELKVTQEKELSGVASQIAEISAGYSRIVKAPISGRVATVQGSLGHRITNQKPLVTLLPDDSLWEAHLYVPSRAIGKVEVGQSVRIQYEAFPFQVYGSYLGKIKNVSQSILYPDELQNQAPIHAQVPVYLVTVALDHQSVEVSDRQFPLQAGMLIQADIILENQRLWQWLLGPLFSMR